MLPEENKITPSKPLYGWTVVQVSPNLESVFIEDVTDNLKNCNHSDALKSTFCPASESTENKNKRANKILPGYVALELLVDHEVKVNNIISQSKGFIRYLGKNRHKPCWLSEQETQRLLEVHNLSSENKRNLSPGDRVVILKGPLGSFNGIIVKVDEERNMCNLEVQILGRSAYIDTSLNNIERQD